MPWRLIHLQPALADTVRYPQLGRPASQPGLLHLLAPSKTEAPYRYFTFGPSARSKRLLCPRLTSVDPSRHLSMPLARTADRQTSPGRTHPPSRLCPPHLRLNFPYKVPDFEDNGLLIQHSRLLCDSCSSGQRFAFSFLQIPPHDGHPCPRLSGSVLPPSV